MITSVTNPITGEQLPGTAYETIPPAKSAEEFFTENNITHAKVSFQPEENRHGYIHQSGDEITYTIPVETVLVESGELIREDTSSMDALKNYHGAPPRVAEWDGPFEIRYMEFLDKTRYNAETATVTFHPQIPVDRRLVVPDDTWTFTVPIEEVIDDDGDLLEGNTYESDRLVQHDNAPLIAQEWGKLTNWCFRVSIDDIPEHLSEAINNDE